MKVHAVKQMRWKISRFWGSYDLLQWGKLLQEIADGIITDISMSLTSDMFAVHLLLIDRLRSGLTSG